MGPSFKGAITIGKIADLTVIEANVPTVTLDRIKDIHVVAQARLRVTLSESKFT